MKTIQYRITYAEGEQETETVSVRARDINSGFPKVLILARRALGNGTVREISAIEFWQIP